MFFIITGKGGVGRSTCSVLLANYLSKKGETVLYHYVQSPVYRFLERKVNVHYLNVEREAREYLKLRLPLLLRHLLSRSAVFRVFSRLIPGFSELIMLGRMWYDFDRSRYDFYVFDALPTGQILPMLKIPQAGLKSGAGGPVRTDLEKMDKFVRDLHIVLVSLPEQVVHEESEEFIKVARKEAYNIYTVFLNKFYIRQLSTRDIRWIETILTEGRLSSKERKEIENIASFERFFAENSERFYNAFVEMGIRVIKIPLIIEDGFFKKADEILKDFL